MSYENDHPKLYLSNFYPCNLVHEGQSYPSAEQAFQHLKAKDAGDLKLAEDILQMDNPYQLKQLGAKVTPKEKWLENEVQTLKKVVKSKFEQNDALRKRLTESPYTKYYEMTTSLKWASGVTTMNTPLDTTTFQGQNHHGKLLEQLKEEFLAKLPK